MTYKQTKLFMSQIEAADKTSHLITEIGDWRDTPEGDDYWRTVQSKLEARATHGTNDGQPWVEPVTDVGPGYRVATIDDTTRRDREYWTAGGYWTRLDYNDSQHLTGANYRVPVDRIPTDEEARQKERPMVMVRDLVTQRWVRRQLLAVMVYYAKPFITIDESGVCAECKFARHLYPGE